MWVIKSGDVRAGRMLVGSSAAQGVLLAGDGAPPGRWVEFVSGLAH